MIFLDSRDPNQSSNHTEQRGASGPSESSDYGGSGVGELDDEIPF